MGKFLLVIVVFAAIVYTIFWLIERRRARRSPRPITGRSLPHKRTLGPDDDEDFLRELERRRRKAARDKQANQPPKDTAPKPEKPVQKPAEESDKSPQDRPRPE